MYDLLCEKREKESYKKDYVFKLIEKKENKKKKIDTV